MKSLDNLSGPWRGWSIQHGRRIVEAIRLDIGGGRISGRGSDADGRFTVDGTYDAEGRVRLTRRYTYTTEPSQSGVGIPYLYEGRWDGVLVSGRWRTVVPPWDGGPFEMWPEGEEERLDWEREVEEEVRELVGTER